MRNYRLNLPVSLGGLERIRYPKGKGGKDEQTQSIHRRQGRDHRPADLRASGPTGRH